MTSGVPDDRNNARIRHDAAHFADRHQEQALAGETDDLGFYALAVTRHYVATAAKRRVTAFGFHRKPDGAAQYALDHQLGTTVERTVDIAAKSLRALQVAIRIGPGQDFLVGRHQWRSSPAMELISACRRDSVVASMCEFSVVTVQPPRVSSGSSTTTQARLALRR